MNKRYLIIGIFVISVIAYLDMIDSFKYIDTIVLNTIKPDSNIKTGIDTSSKFPFKIQK